MRHTLPAGRIAGIDWQRGLSDAEVLRRRQQYGANDIVETAASGWVDVLRDSARDPMLWFLIGTAVLFVALGNYSEAAILGLALFPILGMDAYLHRRTQASTEGLSSRLATQATVRRNGVSVLIAANELVPGDMASVREGQSFPADGIIVAGKNTQADESSLTGESLPVRKHPLSSLPALADSTSIDNENWGAAGTRLLTGSAQLLVVYTGAETLYGGIVRSARAGTHERTPLQQAVGALVSTLVVAAGVICLALAATRWYQGHGWIDALLSAVTLAVAALPEEFPVVFTFFLGLGVYRLARRRALVQRAVVVENIGRVTCICSDKTGTLTEGRLRLEHCLPAPGVTESALRHAAAIASRDGSADPMDSAILETAPALPARVATYPFTEDRRRETGVVEQTTGGYLAASKGGPETILALSDLTPAEREHWERQIEEWAASGHKVIACAQCHLKEWAGGEPDRGYRFLGLLAFEDPVRPGVAEAVQAAQAAGIRVIMITGDHPATARAIAAEIGIGATPPRVVEGADWATHLHNHGHAGLDRLDVLARSIPAQKLDLVRALRAAGEIVAVTGDGVNDVPALQGADIGIAMGERGTRSAREIASIVLLDDNFRTIVRAIAEGRQLFANLKRSFAYLLMVHIPLVLTAAFIPFAGFPLLYLPVHIVWLELIIHPTALLVFQELPAAHTLQPARRHTRLRFFDVREWGAIGLVGGLATVAVVFGYGHGLAIAQQVEQARAMALTVLIAVSATVVAMLSGLRSRGAWIATITTWLSGLLLMQLEPLARWLHLAPLSFSDWIIATGAGLLAGGVAGFFPLLQRSAN